MEKYLVLATFVGSVIALLFALFTGKRVLRFEEGTPLMSKISRSIREGANAYLRRQYTVVGIFFACMIVVLALFRNLDKIANFKYTLMLAGILLLLSPMIPGLGQEIYGSRIWLHNRGGSR